MWGCTSQEFVKHIEQQFQPGMTWDNHGTGENHWQLDHIIALGLFDLCDEAQQREAFHYTNNQPLWHADHARKSTEDKAKIKAKRLRESATPPPDSLSH
jgi:hypothetical protein